MGVQPKPAVAELAAHRRWAASGLGLLTGDETPVFPGRDFAGRLDDLLRAAVTAGVPAELDLRLFTERAAELGLTRRGQVSANGTARLVEAADGWVAVNLARDDDRGAVPAWTGCGLDAEPWAAIEAFARRRAAGDLAATAQELGIPAAVVGGATAQGVRVERYAAGSGETIRRPLVIDLSSLWAGPLCAHLLGLAGARVVKVESTGRPDAARQGPPAFFDRLHAGHEAVALDFATAEGRSLLRRLISRADVVIEASRPRALEQLGVELEAAFAANPGLVWVSLTAYGRTGSGQDRVGFGDDAAAAGGLVAWDEGGRPLFVGDALADPAAGLMAATAALEALAGGGGVLVDMALSAAAAFVAAADPIAQASDEIVQRAGTWTWRGQPIAPPAAWPAGAPAPAFGAHTAAVLAELT